MKSTTFSLDPNAPTTVYLPSGTDYIYTFQLPLVPAFAIEYFTLQYGPLSTFPSLDDTLQDGKLTVNPGYDLNGIDSKIVIFYHGIRDYKLLFPGITTESLQTRMGEFYREAELAFDTAAWLTFMLMCGALFEGILFDKMGRDSFDNLIQKVASNGMIDSATAAIMQKVRKYRNLVHANHHEEPYVTRVDAMDTRITLDKLLRQG
jgi:hypothetical protein